MRLEIEVKTHRIFLDKNLESLREIKLDDVKVVHYITRVLRLNVGAQLRIFDSSKEYLSLIKAIQKNTIIVEILKQSKEKKSNKTLIVGISILKPNKMSACIDIAVQLGADILIPVISNRCQLSSINTSRLNRIIIESVEQSERLGIPKLLNPINLKDFLDQYNNIFIANENAQETLFEIWQKNILKENTLHGNVSISQIEEIVTLVGPEGGFNSEENQLFQKHHQIKLHDNILRTETALASLLSMIQVLRQYN